MFETTSGGPLATWRKRCLADPTADSAASLGDHRRDYLTYEGPLTGARGSVIRVEAGTFIREALSMGLVTLKLEGVRGGARFTDAGSPRRAALDGTSAGMKRCFTFPFEVSVPATHRLSRAVLSPLETTRRKLRSLNHDPPATPLKAPWSSRKPPRPGKEFVTLLIRYIAHKVPCRHSIVYFFGFFIFFFQPPLHILSDAPEARMLQLRIAAQLYTVRVSGRCRLCRAVRQSRCDRIS